MTYFARNEIVSSTQLVRQFSSFLGRLADNSLSKIGIVKNNEMEAVILPVKEYENLTALAEKASRKNIKDFFGAVDEENSDQMESAVAECRKVDLSEW